MLVISRLDDSPGTFYAVSDHLRTESGEGLVRHLCVVDCGPCEEL